MDDAPLHVEGLLKFEPAPGNRGTRVKATMEFRDSGARGFLAGLAKPFVKYKMRHDLSQLKQLMESGEVLSVKGQPSGRAKETSRSAFEGDIPATQPIRPNQHRRVEHAQAAATS
jgi:hypothetical protein